MSGRPDLLEIRVDTSARPLICLNHADRFWKKGRYLAGPLGFCFLSISRKLRKNKMSGPSMRRDEYNHRWIVSWNEIPNGKRVYQSFSDAKSQGIDNAEKQARTFMERVRQRISAVPAGFDDIPAPPLDPAEYFSHFTPATMPLVLPASWASIIPPTPS